jgi:FtsP/CotA-like multicopper oxidase with cupredoxin domain
VRVYVTNKLSAPTTVHWHGVFLPNGMDGVGGLTQRAIPPGETFRYEWTFRQSGTFMYHSHHDEMTQMAMGLMGMIVVHPREPNAAEQVDRDFVIMLGEWKIVPGAGKRQGVPRHRAARVRSSSSGTYDLLEIRAEGIEVEEHAVEALRDYWVARAELELALGGRLAD